VKNNRDLVVTVAAVAAGLLAGGAALVGLGFFLTLAGTALTGLATAVTFVGAVIGAVLSPVGLLTAAVAYGVAKWLEYSETGKQAWQSLVDAVMPIIETLRATLGGVIDSLMEGDFAGAGEFAMMGLKLAFFEGLDAIHGAFGNTVGVGSARNCLSERNFHVPRSLDELRRIIRV
jgi:hypothetical protein